MVLTVVTLAERPDLIEAMWDMPSLWPAFMLQDPVAEILFGQLPEVFPDYQLVGLDAAGEVIAKVNSVPFRWAGTDDDLPARGWDAILERCFAGVRRGVAASAVSLLEARIAPSLLGTGLSLPMLRAARANAVRLGHQHLFGPVRPAAKAAEPDTPMAEYIARVRDDGLPADSWIRTHARLGARIVRICPASMTVPGTLAQWREWTAEPFDRSGPTVVPGALVPVQVSVEHDYAVYVEPNVWMHHDLRSIGSGHS